MRHNQNGRREKRGNGRNRAAIFGAGDFFDSNSPFGPRGGRGGRGGKGPFGPSGPFGGGKGRGRGRRGMFDREELRLVLLALIEGEPRHGYDLIKLLEERSGGAYAPSPGVIYPSLSMLADEGLIEEQPGSDQRRRFGLTSQGAALLEQDRERAAKLLQRLDDIAQRNKEQRSPQIERAIANLFTAIRHRMSADGPDDMVHDVAAILDEAAQRIERL